MSNSQLTETEPGGESRQYEGDLHLARPHQKSSGQLGDIATTNDPAATGQTSAQQDVRGQQTADNIRYGQNISESGMGGMTQDVHGDALQEGYGRVPENKSASSTGEDKLDTRKAAGFDKDAEMNQDVGA